MGEVFKKGEKNRYKMRCDNMGKATPASLITHVRYCNTIGDLPAYECCVIGGPNSVRGYSVGEIATSRQCLEASAEIRLPIPHTNGYQVYGFAEHGTDLDSSKFVRGNPTQFYNRPGSGSSYGGGFKLGPSRLEYVRDCNSKTGHIFVRFGERH